MKFYLINLDRSVDRLAFMNAQFASLRMKVERFSAISGTCVPEWLRLEFSGPHSMTSGEVGCYASHLCIAQKIVGEGSQFATILEDDARLDADFSDICLSAAMSAPDGWDIIHLSAVVKRPMVKAASLCGGRTLVRYTRNPATTAAYILSNAGARKILSPMPRIRPNDMDNRRAWEQKLNFMGVHPAPARQDDRMTSTMAHEDRWPRGHLDGLRTKIWSMREIGVATYLKSTAVGLAYSLMKRIDGKRRVVVLEK